jgi:L-threonylcarbamoyladenylate synthase
LLGLPTETVYGLAARADSDAAVGAIFALKGRPSDHPLIVHVAGVEAAQGFVAAWPEAAARLAAAFWPGPVTVIVPRRPGLAGAAAGGLPTLALRSPSHPVSLSLLRAAAALGVPGVAAPSANRFGRLSPTTATHVLEEFGPALRVLDGGPCAVGIESTIIDCSRGQPVLLRPGQLTREALETALGEPLLAADGSAPRAPGTLAAHYAPRARLCLASGAELAALMAAQASESAKQGPVMAVYSRTVSQVLVARWASAAGSPALHRHMPDEALAAAHGLFSALRALDASGAALIWVETPPAHSAWDGVRDRLQRAAAA